jgi:hypothetical protein
MIKVFEELAGQDVTVSFDNRDRATISGPGMATVVARRIYEDADLWILNGPTWPAIYAYSETATQARPELYGARVEPTERSVPVRWEVDDVLLFMDLGDVILFARRVHAAGPPEKEK